MISDLLIREAQSSDEAIIYEMVCGLEQTLLDRAAFNCVLSLNFAAKNITYFIAEANHEAIGMISCHIQPLLHHVALVAEIQEMFVYPSFRSQSVGKILIDHTVNFARKQGAMQIEVTSRNTRESAHRFYQREGFIKSHVKLVKYFTD